MRIIIKNSIAVIFIIFALAACGSSSDNTASNKFEGGTKYVYDYIPTIVLAGGYKQMGRQYGYFLGDDIRTVYNLVATLQGFIQPW